MASSSAFSSSGPDRPLELLWNATFERYHEQTGRDISKDESIRQLDSFDKILVQIAGDEKKFDAFRHHHPNLWDGLDKVARPIKKLGGITQSALSLTPFSSASPALGAILFLVASAEDVTKAYDAIGELFTRVSYATERMEEYNKSTMDPKLRRVVVEILCKVIDIMGCAEKLIRNKRWKEYIKVTFLGEDKTVSGLIGDLKSLTEAENALVLALVNSTTLRTENKVDDLAKAQKDSKKETQEKEDQKKLDERLESSNLNKVNTWYRTFKNERMPDTGNWIITDSLFERWVNFEDQILWLIGVGGVGKSSLTTRIVVHLEEKYKLIENQYPTISVCYFYIRQANEELRSLNTLFKNVALQLAKTDKVYRNFAVSACTYENTATAEDTWSNMFLKFFSAERCQSRAFVIVDAVDEAPIKEQRTLLKLMYDLRVSSQDEWSGRLQLAFTARPELQNRMGDMYGFRPAFIDISATKMSADVRKYVDENIMTVKVLTEKEIERKKRVALKKKIVEKLTADTLGMFLWVRLILIEIRDKSRISDIEKVLDAPKDVYDMIRQILERIAADRDSRIDDLNELLTWVTFARREMLLGELKLLLQLRPPIGEGLPDLEDRLRGMYAQFFTLTRIDGRTTEDLQKLAAASRLAESDVVDDLEDDLDEDEDPTKDESGKVEGAGQTDELDPLHSDPATTQVGFSHGVIKDFLLHGGQSKDVGIGVDAEAGHTHIALTCLLVLTDQVAKVDGADWPPPNLSDYAADHFLHHLSKVNRDKVGVTTQTQIIQLLCSIFTDPVAIESWFRNRSWIYGIAGELLANSKMTKLIQSWFSRNVGEAGLTEENRNWIEKAKESVVELLGPIATYLGQAWLTSTGKSSGFTAMFLHGFHTIDSEGLVPKDTTVNEDYFAWIADIPPERIRWVAEKTSCEQNSVYHGEVASALAVGRHFKEAIKEYLLAISKDEGNWWAKGSLAQLYGDLKYTDIALEQCLKVVKSMPEDKVEEKFEYYCYIYDWATLIHDTKTAADAGRQLYMARPSLLSIVSLFLNALDNDGQMEELRDLIVTLDSTTYEGTEHSQLTELLHVYPVDDAVENVAELFEQVDAVRIYDDTIAAAHKLGKAGLANIMIFGKADYFWRRKRDDLQAIDLFEKLCDTYLSNDYERDSESEAGRILTSTSLAEIYLNQAVRAEKSGGDPEIAISKLRRLAQSIKEEDVKGENPTDEEPSSTEGPALVLGTWFSHKGQIEESKKWLQPKMRQAIEMLHDDTPSNDSDAFMAIGNVLVRTNDEKNTLVAFAAVMVSLERQKWIYATMRSARERETIQPAENLDQATLSDTPSSVTDPATNNDGAAESSPLRPSSATAPAAEMDQILDQAPLSPSNPSRAAADSEAVYTDSEEYVGEEPFRIHCDGRCQRRCEIWTSIHACRTCVDTQFCDRCYEIVKAGKLAFRKCDPDHDFLQIYPVTSELIAAAVRRVDGKCLPNQEWLDSLKKEWGN